MGFTSWRNKARAAAMSMYLSCLFLLLSTGTSSVNATQIPEEFQEYTFLSSEVNTQAKQNLGKWLDHVRSTSDSEDEPWAPEQEHDFEEDNEHEEEDIFDMGESLKLNSKHSRPNKFKPKRTIVVAKDGSGDFTTVQAAINDIPTFNKERVLIKIKAGIYREKLVISSHKKYITMEGEMPSKKFDSSYLRTVITYNSTAADLDRFGVPLKTFRSATFAVNAPYFIAKYISFKNTAPKPPPGAVGGQAVAVRISADKAAFYRCRFYGNQDTLYDHKGRHYFQNCFVQGTIDFIFGNGRSLYERCRLNALSNSGVAGSITAQKRNTTSMNTGFAFLSSLITGYGSVFLGRAWGNDSRVVFANTFMTNVVVPDGWNDWGIPAREKTVYYAEYNCTGPGFYPEGRVHWSQQLTFEQARPFLTIGYINGKKWLQNPKSIEKEEKRAIAAEKEAANAHHEPLRLALPPELSTDDSENEQAVAERPMEVPFTSGYEEGDTTPFLGSSWGEFSYQRLFGP